MKLNETVEMMNSIDYKERFKAEYFQLKIRIDALDTMLVKYRDGTLSFTPSCNYDILNGQLETMRIYLYYLERRAQIEDIQLNK